MRRNFLRHTLVMIGLVCLFGAAPGLAANVVQVRVGNHPTFTRVVFQLDSPAGYRIEKGVDKGVGELIVTLEAASTPRSVRSGSPEVGLVTVQDGTVSTVAHIRLRRDNAGVKELILSNPPRIVIDLLRDPKLIAAEKMAAASKAALAKLPAEQPAPAKAPEPKLAEAKPPEPAAAPKPMPKAAAAPVAPKAESKPAETPVEPKPAPKLAETPVAPKPEPKLAVAPIAPKPAAKPVETPVTPKPEPKPAVVPVAPVEPKPAPMPVAVPVAPKPEPKLAAAPVVPKPESKPAESPEASSPEAKATPVPPPAPDAKPAAPEIAKAAPPETPIPAPVAKPPAPAATARPHPAPPAPGSLGLEPMQIAALAGGVLLLIILVVMLMRRRRLPNDLDVTALADEDAEPASITEGLDFGAGERAAAPPPPRQVPLPPLRQPAAAPAPAPAAAPAAAPAGLFADTDQDLFDTSEKGESKMSQDTLDLPISRSARPAAGQAAPASAGDSDVGRLMRELERRVAQLETRLDEANDARERLERQVAAQSEELRVQRAAIARTQRALRGLNRGEEEQATEPALRDPNRPMGGN